MTCAHPGCKCTVQSGKFGNYCSEHCQKTGDRAEPSCT
jgi:hypothetical protein